MDKKCAPMGLVIIGLVVVSGLTILYGYGTSSNNLFMKSGGFVGNILCVIALCNISYKKGFEKQ